READALRNERRLLEKTDPVPAIHKAAANALRAAVNKAHTDFRTTFDREKAAIEANENWRKLSSTQRNQILAEEAIDSVPSLDVSDDAALLICLQDCPLSSWKTQTNALSQQFTNAALAAAKLLEPKTQQVHLTSATLKTAEEVKAWLAKTEEHLLEKLAAGPVMIT
ncbi:MAG TPA: hypothetical protein VF879_03850, partial [Nitrospirales bacterium]